MLADPDIAEWGGADEVFARLAGAWSLARSIDTGASMAGRATFTTRSDGSLAYHERGLLTLSGSQTFEAERRYVFRASPGGFSVFFAETPERLFHRIVLIPVHGGLRGEAVHPCRDDSYVSTYDFHGDRFAITHDVSGPTKSYRSHTTYTR
ncbi:MAG: hypothetical protein A4S14_03605 [Proteobacteria bacterium SG_bin9]|nr:MAG: hypothetical protein A4S14_03605 [Proteobacteria bacterium SG_bin9]